MKTKLFFICFAVFILSCKRNTTATTESELKKSMNNFLYSNIKYDSSKVKYRVETVHYKEAVNYYDCEFSVRVISPKKDTTGIMTATISKDFKTINRKS